MEFRIPTVDELAKRLPSYKSPSSFYGPPLIKKPSDFYGPPVPSPVRRPTVTAQAPSGFPAYKYADDPTVYRASDNYGFTSAQEFLGAGGNFATVQVRQRPAINLPGGTFSVDPMTGETVKMEGQGLSLPPVDIFSIDDLRLGLRTPSSASAITSFLDNLKIEREKYRSELAGALQPSQAEIDIETELSALRDRAGKTSLAAKSGMLDAEGKLIPMHAIVGEQEAIAKRANLDLETMAQQEQTLLSRLGIEQGKRKSKLEAAKLGLDFLNQDSDTFFKAQSAIREEQKFLFDQVSKLRDDAQDILGTIIDKFKGLDIDDLDPQTQSQLITLAGQAGIPMNILVSGMKIVKDKILFDQQIELSKLTQQLPTGQDITLPDGTILSPSDKLSNTEQGEVRQLINGDNLMTQLEGAYASAVGKEYQNFASGPVSRLKGLFTRTIGGALGFNQAWNSYKSLAESNLSLIARGLKQEKGTLTDKDVARARKAIPGPGDTPYEASRKFAFIREQIKNALGLYGNINSSTSGERRTIDGVEYEKAEGGWKKVSFNPVGKPQASAGMRTDRHNNPTAFTTDIARIAGLKEGVDYVRGDPFSGGKYFTAKLLKDPIATTIKVIDRIGFKTSSGGNRWSYTDQIPQTKNWNRLTIADKKRVIAQMYKHEGGSALRQIFT